ncbi:MAG: hypothetical protein HYU36_14825 [Planctomycetes bacterium]|nr:hypothetical protein [Planctomycetota bacterium]
MAFALGKFFLNLSSFFIHDLVIASEQPAHQSQSELLPPFKRYIHAELLAISLMERALESGFLLF